MAKGASSGEAIGKLQVDVVGDVSLLDAALDAAEKRLNAMVNKKYEIVVNASINESAAPAGKRGRAKAAATGATAAAPSDQTAINGVLKVNSAELRKSIQTALEGHQFKLNLDLTHLRQQVEKALEGIAITGATVSHAPGTPGPSQAPMNREIPKEFDTLLRKLNESKIKENKGEFNQLVNSISELVGQHGGSLGKNPMERLSSILSKLGDTPRDWFEVQGGKKTGAGPAGVDNVRSVFGVPQGTAQVLSAAFDKVQKKLASDTGQQLVAGLREFHSSTGGPAATTMERIADQQASQQKEVARNQPPKEPVATPLTDAYNEAKKAQASRIRNAPFFGEKRSIDDIIGGLASAETVSGSRGGTREGPRLARGSSTPLRDAEGNLIATRTTQDRVIGIDQDPGSGGTGSARMEHRGRGGAADFQTRPGITYGIEPGPFLTRSGKVAKRRRVLHQLTGGEATSFDLEADETAQNSNLPGLLDVRKGRRALRGSAGGKMIDLEGLARTLERGGLRNLAADKDNNLIELSPRGNTAGELEESAASLKELQRRNKGRAVTLPNALGVEGQVRFLKPEEAAELIARKLHGDAGAEFLAQPQAQLTLKQAIRQGGKNVGLSTNVNPAGTPSEGQGTRGMGSFTQGTGLGGIAKAMANAEELEGRLSEIDDKIAEHNQAIARREAKGKPTDNLQAGLARLTEKREKLQGYLEESDAIAGGRRLSDVMSPDEARAHADADKTFGAQNRGRIATGHGLSLREETERMIKDPSFLGAVAKEQIEAGLVADPAEIVKALEGFKGPKVDEQGNLESRKQAIFKKLAPAIAQEKRKSENADPDLKRTTDDIISTTVRAIFQADQDQQDEQARSVDLAEAGRGRGHVPKKQAGVELTGVSTKGGAAGSTPVFTRPVTSLDVEQQLLRKQLDKDARAVAQGRVAQIEADRAASGTNPELFDKVGVDDILFAPPTTGAHGGTKSTRRIKSDIMREVEATTDAGKRSAEIRQTQAEADAALDALNGAVVQGPFADAKGKITQGKRVGAIEGINEQRAAIGSNPNLSEAARKEALEVLEARTAQAARRIAVRNTKDPLTGDEAVDKASAAGGHGRAGGAGGGGGYNGPSDAFGGRLPLPLPVYITGPFPLQVKGMGGGGGGGGGRGSGPTAATPTPRDAEAERLKALGATRASASKVPLGPPNPFSLANAGKIQMLDRPDRADLKSEQGDLAVRMVENPSLSKQRQAALVAAAKKNAALQRRLNKISDPEGLAQQRDLADDEFAPLRARVRSTQRRVPSRGFGASLTDLVTSSLGGAGFEKQLESLGRAQREAAEVTSLGEQRAKARTERRGLLREEAAAIPGSERQVLARTRINELNHQILGFNKSIKLSSDNLIKHADAASKGSTVLKSFLSAGVGGAVAAAAGSVSFGLGMAVTGPLISAISEGLTAAVSPIFEKLTGNAGTAGGVIGGLSEQTRATAGRSDIATAQLAGSTGLGASSNIRGVLADRAEIVAGNNAIQEQINLFKTYMQIQKEGGANAAATQTTGGFAGTFFNGVAPASQTIGDLISEFGPPSVTGVNGPTGRGPAGTGQGAPIFNRGVRGQPPPEDPLLNFLNSTLQKGNETARFVATANSGLSPAQIAAEKKGLVAAGATPLANQINRVILVDPQGNPITDVKRLGEIVTNIPKNAAKPELEDLLAAAGDQLKSSEQLRARRRGFTLDTTAPAERGLEEAAHPQLPAGTGLTASEQKKYNTELTQTQKLQDQITKDAEQGQEIAKNLVKNQLGDTAGADFASSLDKVASIGKEIAGIQIGVQTQQAALAAAQYSNSLRVARRSLADALALQGKITGSTKDNLGAVERQQFLLGRQSQALSLEQSQRGINFQVAQAGFTAPGLTSEEREARIQQAKKEAEYAQKQLDIQKQLFGLGGKQFQITASRSVTDLVANIGLLEQGREVQLNTIVAEKKIAALTKLQEIENKKVTAYYQDAVAKTNDIMQLEADLVAQTGRNLAEVAKQVLAAYAKVMKGLSTDLSGLTTDPASGISDSRSEGARSPVGIIKGPGSATGLFNSPTSVQAPISIVVTGNTVRKDSDLDEIARKVEAQLSNRGQLLGLRVPGR